MNELQRLLHIQENLNEDELEDYFKRLNYSLISKNDTYLFGQQASKSPIYSLSINNSSIERCMCLSSSRKIYDDNLAFATTELGYEVKDSDEKSCHLTKNNSSLLFVAHREGEFESYTIQLFTRKLPDLQQHVTLVMMPPPLEA